jgi:xanthine dehydrogenase accessory factor
MSTAIIRELAAGQGPVVLVTVVSTEGSVPRHAGSKMIVRADRSIAGTVGGGRPEAMAIETAMACMREGRDELISVEMQGADAEGKDLLCGGRILLLVEHVVDREVYREVSRLLGAGERSLLARRITKGAAGAAAGGAICTPVAVSMVLLDGAGSRVAGDAVTVDAEAAARSAHSGRPRWVEEQSLFYDPLVPDEKLLIFGAGHVGKAIAAAAVGLGFAVTVADDRPEYLDPRRFPPGVATVSGSFTEIAHAYPWDGATYAVIVTRGHLFDLESVRAVLDKTWRYAGFMGSSRKVEMLLDQVRRDGADPATIDRLHAPIGIDIDAETPEEIAVSILAEIVAVRRGDGSRHPSSMSKGRH